MSKIDSKPLYYPQSRCKATKFITAAIYKTEYKKPAYDVMRAKVVRAIDFTFYRPRDHKKSYTVIKRFHKTVRFTSQVP
jgi:hypothetical protein